MRRFSLIFSFLLLVISSNAQELNCEVVVNADRIISGNNQVFKTLQSAVSEFVNQTIWTDKTYAPQERIDCSMIITLDKQIGNAGFKGSIQVLSSRPVFNSIYTTPLISHNDKSFSFSYTEHEPLIFNKNAYQSELISILSYYAYLIIGVDADSYELKGGSKYFDTCRTIIDQVESANDKEGWKSSTSKMNRYHIIDKLMANTNLKYRRAMYEYHINGLDKMTANKKEAKNTIAKALIALKQIYSNNMSKVLFKLFMNAKADEIVSIFSGGPHIETINLVNTLNKISPTNANKWVEIK